MNLSRQGHTYRGQDTKCDTMCEIPESTETSSFFIILFHFYIFFFCKLKKKNNVKLVWNPGRDISFPIFTRKEIEKKELERKSKQ